ncbi:MAG TPA: hypothetical protein VIU29_01765, partial [Candidatus Deferrimicrobiaceae bacterium]
ATGKIADGAVTPGKISGVISGDKLGTHAHSGADLNDGSVATSKIADVSVTTNKIADGAVTNAKIQGPISGDKLGAHAHSGIDLADGSVTTNKIADGAVTNVKIQGVISGDKLGAHTHNGIDLADGSVATSKIADGAVTNAKILGLISADKLPVGTTTGTVAAGNHTHVAVPPKYANVIVVAKSGGDFTDPVSALRSITDASASNPYLVKIMPGVYPVAITSFNMKDYVDVEGSGPGVTVLSMTSNHMGHAIATVYYANGVSHAELRNLAIDHTGGSYVFGINVNNGEARVSNVDIRIQGGSWNGGVIVGDYYVSKALLTNVNIKVVGTTANVLDQTYGVVVGSYNALAGSSATLKNVKIEVSNGEYTGGLRVYPNATAFGAGVQTNLPLDTRWTTGTFKCVSCYDADFNLLP